MSETERLTPASRGTAAKDLELKPDFARARERGERVRTGLPCSSASTAWGWARWVVAHGSRFTDSGEPCGCAADSMFAA
jgi:hypothetical protein